MSKHILICAVGFAAAAAAVSVAAQPTPSSYEKTTPSNYDCLIEARQQVDVRSSAEGVIESVHVRRGDVIKKGQLLARLSSGPESAALDLARSRASMEGER